MSIDYVEATVRPAIPAKCLTQVEAWLLRRVFKTEENGNYLSFDGFWTLNDLYDETLSFDEELRRALVASRQVCPELCAAVERQIGKVGWIKLGAVDYETIFQAVIRRHPDFLEHISIAKCYSDTGLKYFDQSFTLISATSIESIYGRGEKIVHRTGPWRPESPYIFVSEDEDNDEDEDEDNDNVVIFPGAAARRPNGHDDLRE
jgi:hypothetical protein